MAQSGHRGREPVPGIPCLGSTRIADTTKSRALAPLRPLAPLRATVHRQIGQTHYLAKGIVYREVAIYSTLFRFLVLISILGPWLCRVTTRNYRRPGNVRP